MNGHGWREKEWFWGTGPDIRNETLIPAKLIIRLATPTNSVRPSDITDDSSSEHYRCMLDTTIISLSEERCLHDEAAEQLDPISMQVRTLYLTFFNYRRASLTFVLSIKCCCCPLYPSSVLLNDIICRSNILEDCIIRAVSDNFIPCFFIYDITKVRTVTSHYLFSFHV